MTTLYVREEAGYREASADELMDCAHALITRRFRRGAPVLSSPLQTREVLRMHLGTADYEVFGLLHLNAKHRLIQAEDLFRGTVDGATVHPREVVKAVLAKNASAVICYHNHPSGDPQPSVVDDLITQRLREALALINVRLLDHLIVGDTVFSYAEAGLL